MVSDKSRPAKGPFTLAGGQSAHDLRMAFDLAVDKTKLASVVCGNILCAPATGGLITKGLTGYLGDNQDPLAAFDPTKAKALLKSADPDGSKTPRPLSSRTRPSSSRTSGRPTLESRST